MAWQHFREINFCKKAKKRKIHKIYYRQNKQIIMVTVLAGCQKCQSKNERFTVTHSNYYAFTALLSCYNQCCVIQYQNNFKSYHSEHTRHKRFK